MLIEVPFIYTANVLFERQLKPRAHKVRGWHPTMVHEASAEDAVLVANMKCDEYFEHEPPRMDVRHWQGEFWAPVIRGRNDRRDTPFFTAEAYTGLMRSIEQVDIFSLSNVDGWRWREAAESLEAIQPKRVVSTDAAEETRKIDERAGRLLIVDGTVFRRVTEPVMSVSYHRHGRDIPMEISLSTGFLGDLRGNRIRRADDFDALMEEFEGKAAIQPNWRQNFLDNKIEVYRADLLKWCPERQDLVIQLKSFTETVIRQLAGMSVEQFGSYVVLREAVKGLDPERDDGVEEACLAAEGVQHFAYGGDGTSMQTVLHAISNWREVRARDMDMDVVAMGM